jgi:hypothetical protein
MRNERSKIRKNQNIIKGIIEKEASPSNGPKLENHVR